MQEMLAGGRHKHGDRATLLGRQGSRTNFPGILSPDQHDCAPCVCGCVGRILLSDFRERHLLQGCAVSIGIDALQPPFELGVGKT